MDDQTADALSIIAKRLKTFEFKPDTVVNMSPRESAAYIILLRAGWHLHPEPQAKELTTLLISLVGVASGLHPPHGSTISLLYSN